MPIKGIHVSPRKLANGKVRYHYYTGRGGEKFWTTEGTRIASGGRKVPVEFIKAYHEARGRLEKPAPHTFAAAVAAYREQSKTFLRMRPKGKLARIRYLDSWLAMPLAQGRLASETPLSMFDHRRIVTYIIDHRDKEWGHSPSSADEAVFAISAFLKWCRSTGRLNENKAKGIETCYARSDKSRLWTQSEQKRFLTSAPATLAWAFRLALLTGLRREDLTRLPIASILKHHIVIPTGKSGGQNEAIIPIIPPLRALLEELDQARLHLPVVPVTVLFSSRGTPWTAEGLSSSFDRHRNKNGLGSADGGPTMHDLRKTCATNMVIQQHKYPALITDQILKESFGWTTGSLAKMKRIYVSDQAVIDAMTDRK